MPITLREIGVAIAAKLCVRVSADVQTRPYLIRRAMSLGMIKDPQLGADASLISDQEKQDKNHRNWEWIAVANERSVGHEL